MAATANPMASEAARAVLREGGSAVDAAIAAQMVLAVVEPQSSGLGGGSLLMVWDAASKNLAYYEGLASAPAHVHDPYTQGPDGQRIATEVLERTGRVVAVPGTLRTLALVQGRYGKLPWDRLFRDAIRLATDGAPLSPYLHRVLRERIALAHKPPFDALYFSATGEPLPVGTILRNPDLAQTLRRVASEGPDAFYTGTIAAGLTRAVADAPYPGTITQADFSGYETKLRDPVCDVVFGHRVCTAAPPASGGIALLQQLRIAERLNIAAAAPGSVEAAHLFIEAARLSAADRRAYIGDPDQVDVPVTGLLDTGYLDDRAALVFPDRAMAQVSAGDPPRRHGAARPSDPLAQPATSHLSIIDDDGNAVSMTTTINQNFGADIVAGGVVLNNAITNFASRPEIGGKRMPNAIAPGKRPISTMAPTIVFAADGRPMLVVGAGGGARIIDSVAATIIGVLAWHQDVRAAIAAPRAGGQNGAQELERGTPMAALAPELRAMGHAPKVTIMDAGVQAVAITPDGLDGWGDARRDGVALGD